VGTLEEILYLLGILLHPDNQDVPVPVIFAGPESSRDYFAMVDDFVAATLGDEARKRYSIITGDPVEVARQVRTGVNQVHEYRRGCKDAFFFNWQLRIQPGFQQPFEATHESMAALNIDADMEPHELAANLRRAFSGIVAGNIRDEGIRAIEQHGPFEIRGDRNLMQRLDVLLQACVSQGRMRLPGKPYEPCFRVVS
jgi:hypothetical protein